MNVVNTHVRQLPVPLAAAGQLIDRLASVDDGLWPGDHWPPMRFDRPLAVGAHGGHGPIRYTVDSHEPQRSIRFRFTAPSGFIGTHGFDISALRDDTVQLRHTLMMNTRGASTFLWPVVFRPLHDALIEDAFDRAEKALGLQPRGKRWSLYVRALRWILSRRRRPS